MEPTIFREKLETILFDNIETFQDQNKNWVIKGFIDIYKNIYPISIDTKVVSKIIELMIFPTISKKDMSDSGVVPYSNIEEYVEYKKSQNGEASKNMNGE
jgi:uncharacterized protein (UPF0335 family)